MQNILAQFTPARIPPLPSPPLLERLLYEQPLPLICLLVALGAVAYVVLTRRGQRQAGYIAAGVLAILAVGAVVLAHVVQTDREKMTAATHDLVSAAAAGDSATLGRLLAQDVRLFNRFKIAGMGCPSGCGREWILNNDPQVMKQYRVADPSVRECQAVSTGPGVGATQVLVRIQATPMGDSRMTHRSWWRLDWRREESGEWVVTAVEPLDVPFASLVE